MTDKIDLSAGPPPIPIALVEYLEQVWPDRFPTIIGSSPDLIAMEIQRIRGCREVVEFLRHHCVRQSIQPRQVPHRSPF